MTSTDACVPRGLGAVVSIPYGPVAEWLAEAGFGWIVIDAEHAPIGPEQQLALITATHAAGAAAYVRVASLDDRAIGFALDAGAEGVIVPSVSTLAEALRAAAACRYPRRGTRSIGPIRRQTPSPCCIVQLETVESVARGDAIARVDGVDALMVGPGDLALDAGLLPGIDGHHPRILELQRQVRSAAASAGKPSGTFAVMGEGAVRQAQVEGWEFIAGCLDRLALVAGAVRLGTPGEE